MPELSAKRDRLLGLIRGYGSCAVAFSGGIDSTVVAKAAQLALGDRAIAVTGTSASLATGELDEARSLAREIGIRHEILVTREFASADYVRNDPDRCFHCKTELYTQMSHILTRLGVAVMANGTNADDLADYRPGLAAAANFTVASPLAECGFTKADVRALAAEWGLSNYDKPAAPCLSSRIAYGEEVTPERLAMIDRAEQYLRSLGLGNVRVRYHKGDVARVEVPTAHLAKLASPETREPLVESLKRLGFKYITLDLEGFRSGSLNVLVEIEGGRKP